MVYVHASNVCIAEEFDRKLVVAENGQNTDSALLDGGGINGGTDIRTPFDVEIRLKKPSHLMDVEKLQGSISEFIFSKLDTIRNCRPFAPNNDFSEMIDRMVVSCLNIDEGSLLECAPERIKFSNFHFYVAKKCGSMAEGISLDGESSSAVGSEQWEIPCLEFDNLWETLIFDGPIKFELLNFINSILEISHAGADFSLLSLNRLILLHGPPGTGKTTLCKALAQKLAIRTRNRYKRTLLVEVNSHSLFSKWFSESGKLIQKLFANIEELAEHANWLVFVLIDEVESLTMGRNAVFSGSDPSDSVRAVNAVLTQLDKIRRFPNVFILCTSNLEKALDPAFVDRADLIRRIGKPSNSAIQAIIESGIEELQRIGLIKSFDDQNDEERRQNLATLASRCAAASFSGRSLRKLPVLAYSLARSASSDSPPIDANVLLDSFGVLFNSSCFQTLFD